LLTQYIVNQVDSPFLEHLRPCYLPILRLSYSYLKTVYFFYDKLTRI